MKIDKSSLPVTAVGEGKVKASVAKSGSNTPADAASGTSVNLGSSAQLRSMEESMANAPVVNAAKVAEIKQAISEGRFQVNAGAVADSLIQSVTDLISSHKP